MRFAELVARLEQLPADLPPPPAELLPKVLRSPPGAGADPGWPSGPRRSGAVLLLLYPDEAGATAIVLTERHQGSHRHAGQISLPGGAVDDADESVVATALREAQEEVGLDAAAADVEVKGVVAPVDVRVSGFLVHPVVAVARYRPELVADPREVAAILHAPLAAFVPPAPIEIVTAERDGYLLRYGAYRLGEHVVWGATAAILGRFGAFLGGTGRPAG